MSKAALARLAFGVTAALVLVVCLLGIMFTGPVTDMPPAVEWRVQVSPQRMRATVEEFCAEFTPRDHEQPETLDRAAEWIAERLRAAGLAVEFQEYRTSSGSYRNVIARQDGLDATADAWIVGTHYDAFGGFPGADDSASGVAVLLELVRTLPQPIVRAPRYFVAFGTGEPPLQGTDDAGSVHFARKLAEDGVHVEQMIALDTVGYYTDAPGSQRYPLPGMRLFYPGRGDFAAVVGDLGSGRWLQRVKRDLLSTRAIPVYSFRAPSWLAPLSQSDHLALRELGLPGVLITDTAHLRNPNLHTAQDTPETLDYTGMAHLVQALHGALFDPEIPLERPSQPAEPD